MKQFYSFLLFIVSILCFSSCSSDDYDFASQNDAAPMTRAIENPMQLKIYLCVSYDPSITDYNRFVIFKNITITALNNPENTYTKSVSYAANDNQCIGTVDWSTSNYVTFTVGKFDVIQDEFWDISVDCRANQGYYVYGDYKVSLYCYGSDDLPKYLDSHICVNAQGGDDFTLTCDKSLTGGLDCEYTGQDSYYISLHVEPVD